MNVSEAIIKLNDWRYSGTWPVEQCLNGASDYRHAHVQLIDASSDDDDLPDDRNV